ncbi:hypothetical protein RIF29_00063 [Crotalaria pallida]|uniref:Uncharacterized protein n=1 Tax=Crotalaria pallida TaxID=3830 RepID=A0AAN9P721_CROPI
MVIMDSVFWLCYLVEDVATIASSLTALSYCPSFTPHKCIHPRTYSTTRHHSRAPSLSSSALLQMERSNIFGSQSVLRNWLHARHISNASVELKTGTDVVRYEQSLEHTSQFIERLEKELEEYHHHLAKFKKGKEDTAKDAKGFCVLAYAKGTTFNAMVCFYILHELLLCVLFVCREVVALGYLRFLVNMASQNSDGGSREFPNSRHRRAYYNL